MAGDKKHHGHVYPGGLTWAKLRAVNNILTWPIRRFFGGKRQYLPIVMKLLNDVECDHGPCTGQIASLADLLHNLLMSGKTGVGPPQDLATSLWGSRRMTEHVAWRLTMRSLET